MTGIFSTLECEIRCATARRTFDRCKLTGMGTELTRNEPVNHVLRLGIAVEQLDPSSRLAEVLNCHVSLRRKIQDSADAKVEN